MNCDFYQLENMQLKKAGKPLDIGLLTVYRTYQLVLGYLLLSEQQE